MRNYCDYSSRFPEPTLMKMLGISSRYVSKEGHVIAFLLGPFVCLCVSPWPRLDRFGSCYDVQINAFST